MTERYLASREKPIEDRRLASRLVVAVSSFVAHRFNPETPFAVSAAAKAGLEAFVMNDPAAAAKL